MHVDTTLPADFPPQTQAFYARTMRVLAGAEVPVLVGGAYALAQYTGIVRHTKDCDLFLRPRDYPRALAVLRGAGFRTEATFRHWLGKVFHDGDFVDLIHSSGNGVAKVDDQWFEHAVPSEFLGEPVRLCPVEETIWSKSFVCERERFDGADINHLLLARGAGLDWPRLLARFGPHWRVLLAHLALFGFVYPAEGGVVPGWVLAELCARLLTEGPGERVCQGTLLSRTQYRTDVERWGYPDARLDEEASMTAEQVRRWTEAGPAQ
jgi:hypothetical protein